MPSISVGLFGSPVLRRDGAPVTGRAAYRRRLALLAILAAARGRPVSRDRLIGLLWPEHTAEKARHTLSESLYVLRKELGEEVFLPAGSDVALDPARVASDLEAFERALDEGRLADAAEAYRAPFLDGFYVDDAPEFERWAEGERDRLARAFARAVEELADAAEAQGDPLAAAAWWRRLAAHDPYSARVALRLAAALGRGGETAAALRHAEEHAAFLREELGVGLDPELAALVQRLRAGTVPLPPRPPLATEPEPEPVDAPSFPPVGEESGESVEEEDVSAPAPLAPPRQPRPRWPLRGLPGAAAALLLVGIVAVGAWMGGGGRETEEEGLDPNRIAVLYFDDHSPGGALEYLAGGLTESLIHELSQVEALEVVSRNGVKPYRRGTVPLDSVVAQLRAGSLVEGSIQRSGDSVRVTVQLIDGRTLAHLDSRVVDRPLDDVLALQEALSQEVSAALRRRLGREVRLREAAREAASPRALEQVLRAEQLRADAAAVVRSADFRDARSALEMLGRADSLLAAAQAESPGWARPTLARGWVALDAARLETGEDAVGRVAAALALAERAVAREPLGAEALELRGRARWIAVRTPGAAPGEGLPGVERDLRRSLEAEPERASAWGALSQVVLAEGRFGEAQVAADRALEHDAWLEEAPIVLLRLYFAALGLADHASARRACERGARMFPADWQFVECQLTLLRVDTARPPDAGKAWRLVARLDQLDAPAAARAAGRGYAPLYRRMAAAAVSARAGDADSARAVVAWARRLSADDADARAALGFDEAYVRLFLGDREGARRSLEAYVAARPEVREYVLREPVVGTLLSPRPAAPP